MTRERVWFFYLKFNTAMYVMFRAMRGIAPAVSSFSSSLFDRDAFYGFLESRSEERTLLRVGLYRTTINSMLLFFIPHSHK